MGFSWTSITQYVTEIAAAHINQVKTNIDSVYTDLGLDAYGWAYLPVATDEEMQHEDFKELRDAIDYADDQNYCRSHDASYDAEDNATYRGTVKTSDNTEYDSGYKLGVDSNYYSTYKNDYNSGVDVAHKGAACGPVQSFYKNAQKQGLNTLNNQSYS